MHLPFSRTLASSLLLAAASLSLSRAQAAPAAAPPCPPAADGVVLCEGFAAGKDYFIEARIRALPGGSASGQLYLLGRYVDAQHWLGAGLNVTDGSPTVQAEIVSRRDGDVERLKQVKRTIVSEGRWLTVRFEINGQALTIYLNGEKLSTGQVAQAAAAGRVGLYSNGKRFEVADVRVGDPADKPMRLAPAVGEHRFQAQAGDTPSTVAISAFAGDGLTREPFTAISSNPAVLTVAAADTGVTVTPVAAGTASITLTSVSDPGVQAVIDATIAPPFIMPADKVALGAAVTPAAGAARVQIDSTLRLKFDRPATLGSTGSVRIYRKDDDRLVDLIRLGDEVTAIGHAGQDQQRHVRHTPITLAANVATIKPHANRLAYGTAYYVVVEEGVFAGASLGGAPFKGIGKAAGWTFRTRSAAPTGSKLTVDNDGPADFRTVQGALNHAMQHIGKDQPATIVIANGDYDEMLFIRGKDKLTLRGQSRDGVVIHSGNNDGTNPGSGLSQGPDSPSFSGGRSLLLVEAADLLTLDTLTLKNTTLRSDKIGGQAETIYFNNEGGRLIAKNANFFSEQDTIQVKGYSWFYHSLVAGNVDFIWGANRVALFEESEIRSVGDSANRSGGGYLVQARTVLAADKGFVFLNSTLTSGPGPAANLVPAGSTYLARSPGTTATWDNVSFINCKMGEHIAAGGWAVKGVQRQPGPNPAVANADSGWREFGTTDLNGQPLDLSKRVGGYTLSADEAAARFSTRAIIFSAFDGGRGWNPAP